MPNFGKLMDKVKGLAGKHPDQVNRGVGKAEQFADEKTGGKYDSQVQQVGQRAEGFLGTQGQTAQGQSAQGQSAQGQSARGQSAQGGVQGEDSHGQGTPNQ